MTLLDAEALAKEHGPMLSRLARQFFSNGEDASDALQEAWLEIVRSLPQFRGESHPKTWVYRIAWRKMLAHRNQGRRETLKQVRHRYDLVGIHSPPPSPETRVWIEAVCHRCMLGVLHCLTAEQRLAFLFRYIARFEYAELAMVLETSEANARQLCSRARALITRFVTEDCAHSGPQAHCRWGADPWVRNTGLQEAVGRLGSFAHRVEAYRAVEGFLPTKNQWEDYLQTGQVPRSPAASPSSENSLPN